MLYYSFLSQIITSVDIVYELSNELNRILRSFDDQQVVDFAEICTYVVEDIGAEVALIINNFDIHTLQKAIFMAIFRRKKAKIWQPVMKFREKSIIFAASI